MSIPPVSIPSELQNSSPELLEDYVRSRIVQLINTFTRILRNNVPSLSPEAISQSLAEALSAIPPPIYDVVPLENRELQLVFRHDCQALGCLDPQCSICQHNPSRRCIVNFDRKYLVHDNLKARCAASIRIELIDRNTGLPVDEEIPQLKLETYILDGNLYDSKFLEGGTKASTENGTESLEDLESCALLLNKKKSTPLLVCGNGGSNDIQGKVIIPITRGRVALPDMHVTDSSEAILSGRKPPFRLLVRALLPSGTRQLNIRHAISEGFVVATRRTRTAGKVDIPSIDDHVSKLEHMGKETVKKLQDIHTAAAQVGIEIDIPENSIQRVGDFKLLALRAEQDGHLRQRLQHVLKLSREKWEEARDHAMRAVVGDSRMRAWYVDRRTMDFGLLFTCRLGTIDLERPVALLQSQIMDGEPKVETVLMADLSPAQRDMVRSLQPQAAQGWWNPGHPGWAIFPMDSELFLQSGSAVMSHLQLDTDNQLQLPLDPSLGMMGMMGMTSPPSGVNGGDASGFRNHSFSGGAAISSPHLIYHGEGPSFASPPSFNSGVNRSGSGSKLPQHMYGGGAMPMPTHHLGQYGGDLSHQQQMQHQIQMMRPPPLPGQGGNGGASAMAPPPTNVGGRSINPFADAAGAGPPPAPPFSYQQQMASAMNEGGGGEGRGGDGPYPSHQGSGPYQPQQASNPQRQTSDPSDAFRSQQYASPQGQYAPGGSQQQQQHQAPGGAHKAGGAQQVKRQLEQTPSGQLADNARRDLPLPPSMLGQVQGLAPGVPQMQQLHQMQRKQVKDYQQMLSEGGVCAAADAAAKAASAAAAKRGGNPSSAGGGADGSGAGSRPFPVDDSLNPFLNFQHRVVSAHQSRGGGAGGGDGSGSFGGGGSVGGQGPASSMGHSLDLPALASLPTMNAAVFFGSDTLQQELLDMNKQQRSEGGGGGGGSGSASGGALPMTGATARADVTLGGIGVGAGDGNGGDGLKSMMSLGGLGLSGIFPMGSIDMMGDFGGPSGHGGGGGGGKGGDGMDMSNSFQLTGSLLQGMLSSQNLGSILAEVGGGGNHGADNSKQGLPGSGSGGSGGPRLQGQNSALDTMQSIEQALPAYHPQQR